MKLSSYILLGCGFAAESTLENLVETFSNVDGFLQDVGLDEKYVQKVERDHGEVFVYLKRCLSMTFADHGQDLYWPRSQESIISVLPFFRIFQGPKIGRGAGVIITIALHRVLTREGHQDCIERQLHPTSVDETNQ